MKKLLPIICSLMLTISACSTEDILANPELENNQNIEAMSVDEMTAQSTTQNNQGLISAISETIFVENFADDYDLKVAANDIVSDIKSNAPSGDISTKGGMLFNLLNKSKTAQKLAYFFLDYPVRYKMNTSSKADNTPRINQQQIAELKSKLQPGDIILCGNNNSFIHAILYFGNDVIIHSLATKVKTSQKFMGVVKESLEEYLIRSERDKFVVLRYKNLEQSDLSKVYDYANKQIGKTYDTLFLLNSDTRFYCTELVYSSLMQLTSPPRVYPHKSKLGWKLVTNEDYMDSPDFETVWEFNRKRNTIGQIHEYK